jgi:hypothetical protein
MSGTVHDMNGSGINNKFQRFKTLQKPLKTTSNLPYIRFRPCHAVNTHHLNYKIQSVNSVCSEIYKNTQIHFTDRT